MASSTISSPVHIKSIWLQQRVPIAQVLPSPIGVQQQQLEQAIPTDIRPIAHGSGMCLIEVGWWWKCSECGAKYFEVEEALRPPYDYKEEIENYDIWAPECDCYSNSYLWAFYNINPLHFDAHHSWPWRNRQFQKMCGECQAAGPSPGNKSDFFARKNARDGPLQVPLYGPGRTQGPGIGLPPLLPQRGEVFKSGESDDSGSSTSIASTPRQQDQFSWHEPTEASDLSTHPGFKASAWYSGSLPLRSTVTGGFFGDEGVNMQVGHRQDERARLERDYIELMQSTRRGSVNRRDDDLGLL